MSSGQFDDTELPRTTVMLASRAVWREFDCTEPPRTTVMKGEEATGLSSGWFDHIEPPRTTMMKSTGQVRMS